MTPVRKIHSPRQYTLIELLVVLSILSILAGIGIAAFRSLTRKGELDATHQLLRSLFRRARNTAREERFPATIEINYETNEVHAVTRQTLAFFRLESAGGAATGDSSDGSTDGTDADPAPAEPITDPGLEGLVDNSSRVSLMTGALNIEAINVNAVPIQEGKIGNALAFGIDTQGSASRSVPPAFLLIEDLPTLSPAEGVFLECWMQPGQLERKLAEDRDDGYDTRIPEYQDKDKPVREAPLRSYKVAASGEMPMFTIMRNGHSYELMLNADYSLEINLTGFNEANEEIQYMARTVPQIVREEKWVRVAVAYDGRSVQLFLNGIERVIAPLSTDKSVVPVRLKVSNSRLTISDPNPRRTFFGALDEVRVAGLIRGTTVRVPAGLLIVPDSQILKFDALGQLDPILHAQAFHLQVSDDPGLLDKVFPEEDIKEKRTKTVERRPEAPDATPKKVLAFRKFKRRARRFLRTVAKKQKREIVVDMHGTLR